MHGASHHLQNSSYTVLLNRGQGHHPGHIGTEYNSNASLQIQGNLNWERGKTYVRSVGDGQTTRKAQVLFTMLCGQVGRVPGI